jgi:hypothetical protein
MNTEYAFPHENNHTYKMTGMTLRDYFAAKAMQAIAVESISESSGNIRLLAKNAYRIADEMIEARK